jgi:hypothetical protein
VSENTAVAYPTHSELLLRCLQRERDNLGGTLGGLSGYDGRVGDDHDELGDAEFRSSYA